MLATGISVQKQQANAFKAKSKHNGKKEGNVSHSTRTIARALLSLCNELGHKPRNLQAIAKIAEYEIEDEASK